MDHTPGPTNDSQIQERAASPVLDRTLLTPHVLLRTIVIESARIVYIPTPKAACTSILWGLADIAGLSSQRFTTAPSPRPTSALTIHEIEVWGPEHRLFSRDDDEVQRILSEDGWFRFTVVREPASRLFSAWQSKVLTHEPYMLNRFRDRAWFPQSINSADDIIRDYRRFLDRKSVV